MDRAALARTIDHSLLAPDATPGRVALACAEAVDLGVAGLCVAPSRYPLPVGALPPEIAAVTVIGFPSGAHRTEIKVAEARRAVEDGATELDVVMDLGLASSKLWDRVTADLAAVRDAVPATVVVKVIIESAWLAFDHDIVAACHAVELSGADFVKTSTGFHPAGGATPAHVELIARTVDGRLGVKASGGIRDLATARSMLDAGATRLGCSATRQILDELEPPTP